MKKIIFALIAVSVLVSIYTKINSTQESKVQENDTKVVEKISKLKLSLIKPKGVNILRAIHFTDESTGFVAGYNGVLLKTMDAGLNWEKVETNTELPIYDITFVNKNIGFAAGGKNSCSGEECASAGPIILRTLDAGITWQKTEIETKVKLIELRSITFVSEKVGFAVGGNSILQTKNAGETWSESSLPIRHPAQKIAFQDVNNGIIVASRGSLLSTINGGRTWQQKSFPNDSGSSALTFSKNNVAYSSTGGHIFKSEDLGSSWKKLENSPIANSNIETYDNLMFAVGKGNHLSQGQYFGSISYSKNKGQTWITDRDIGKSGSLTSTDISSGISDISIPSKNIAYAVNSSHIIKIENI